MDGNRRRIFQAPYQNMALGTRRALKSSAMIVEPNVENLTFSMRGNTNYSEHVVCKMSSGDLVSRSFHYRSSITPNSSQQRGAVLPPIAGVGRSAARPISSRRKHDWCLLQMTSQIIKSSLCPECALLSEGFLPGSEKLTDSSTNHAFLHYD